MAAAPCGCPCWTQPRCPGSLPCNTHRQRWDLHEQEAWLGSYNVAVSRSKRYRHGWGEYSFGEARVRAELLSPARMPLQRAWAPEAEACRECIAAPPQLQPHTHTMPTARSWPGPCPAPALPRALPMPLLAGLHEDHRSGRALTVWGYASTGPGPVAPLLWGSPLRPARRGAGRGC